MAVDERDPVSGQKTTGHEWNGIKELDTPVPRGVLIFIVVTHLFALVWWILMPAFPLWWTYTKGLLGEDQHEAVAQDIAQANAERASWAEQVRTQSFDEIRSNEQLMQTVRQTGHQLFGDNCAACHGRDAKGGFNYPDLTDGDWIWDGTPEQIAETIRTGINSPHETSRVSQMPAFGRDEMLDRTQVRAVAAYVYSLSHHDYSTAENIETIEAGHKVYAENCVACHGETGAGVPDVGGPNLTDAYSIYGGDLEKIVATVHGGRQGHMPTWEKRLSPVEIKVLALYVHSLGTENP